MATWTGTLVATAERPDFWRLAATHGVGRLVEGVPAHVLIGCGGNFEAPPRLAEDLSRALSTMAIGFMMQTSADVHEIHAFAGGRCVRRLCFSRDDGGWGTVEGSEQPWERAYFFDGGTTAPSGVWPDLLSDELSEEETARYEAAKKSGEVSLILSLLHPSSTAPMARVCAFFGVLPEAPAGLWKAPSLWSRLFGRTE